MIKAFRIHPSPFVTTGFLLAFVLLVSFLYGAPMLVSQADEGGESEQDSTTRCGFFWDDCSCDNSCSTPSPTASPIPTVNPCDNYPNLPGCAPPPPPSTVTSTEEPTPVETEQPTEEPTEVPTEDPSTTLPVPRAPTGLTVQARGLKNITLRWNARSGTARYQVDSGVENRNGHSQHNASGTVKTVGGLKCGTEYTFKVRTYGNGRTVQVGLSGWSVTVDATTSACMQITVTASDSAITEGENTVFTITSRPAPASAMTVRFDVGVTEDFVRGHTFARDTEAASSPAGPPSVYFRPNRSSVSFEVLTMDDTVDESNGSVTYAITGADRYGGYVKGSPSTATVTISDNDPPTPTAFPTATPTNLAPAPTSITISDATETSLKVEWSRVSVDYFYKVEKKKAGGSWGDVEVDIQALTITAIGLDCNSYYYLRVSTKGNGSPYNSTHYDQPSTEKSLKTLACPVTPPTTNPNPSPSPTPGNPTFTPTLLYNGVPFNGLGDGQDMSVFDARVLTLKITDGMGSSPTANYQFRVHTTYAETGFQFNDVGGLCDYMGTIPEASNWDTAVNPMNVYVIRCDLGDENNNGFSVY